jgi:GPI ethanolamine phosphate transferase 1
VNSVGELPLDYISGGLAEKAKIVFANALEIAEQYSVKERNIPKGPWLMIDQKMGTEIAFKPFKPLRSEGNHLHDRVANIEAMIRQGKYTEAIEASEDLMKLTLAGLRYLQT